MSSNNNNSQWSQSRYPAQYQTSQPQQHQSQSPPYGAYTGYHSPPPPQYPQAFVQRPAVPQNQQSPSAQQQATFHQYQPPQPSGSTTNASKHPVTAPFLIPRVPHPWPFPGAQERLQNQQGGQGNVPIDPQLLGKGGNHAAQGQGQGRWPQSSGS